VELDGSDEHMIGHMIAAVPAWLLRPCTVLTSAGQLLNAAGTHCSVSMLCLFRRHSELRQDLGQPGPALLSTTIVLSSHALVEWFSQLSARA
jgi:hypothetical protein